MSNGTLFVDEELFLPRLPGKRALRSEGHRDVVVIVVLAGIYNFECHGDASEPASIVAWSLPGCLHSQQPGLSQRNVADDLTLGGEVKLLFLLFFFFGHQMIFEYTGSTPRII
jgi:hypothetical protein